MSTVLYYGSNCGALNTHQCDPCAPFEAARIRSVAVIHKDWVFNDPTDPAEWQAGIDAGKIFVIPATSGEFDGGTAKTITGFGDTPEQNLTYNFKVTYRDPNYKGNNAFYDALKFSRDFRIGFRSDIADKTAVWTPKAAIPDDLQGIIVWEVEVAWISKTLPAPVNTPAGIFECFTVE